MFCYLVKNTTHLKKKNPVTFSIKIVLQTGFNKRQNNWTHHKTRWSRSFSNRPFHVREMLICANLGNKRLKALQFVIAFIMLYCFQTCFFLFLKFKAILGMWALFSKTALVRVSLTKVKTENPRMATIDSLKEAPWCTNCNAK